MNNHFQPTIPNPNPNHHNHNAYQTFDLSEFEFEPYDFLVVEDGSEEDLSSQVVASTEYVSGGSNDFFGATTRNVNMQVCSVFWVFWLSFVENYACTTSDPTVWILLDSDSNKFKAVGSEAERGGDEKSKGEEGRIKVAFRTKSELEIMDDGFKWRKYGKKMVKTSPNPRNYYKCSSGGCNVKKRVERDSEDPSYVITTYDGVHNHQSPSLVYYNQSPDHLIMVPEAQAAASWTFQPNNSSSHYSSS